MIIDRLRELAASYGADLRRWPQDERLGAERLIAADPQAREALEEAARLDLLLDRSRSPAVPASLRERILAQAPRARRRLWEEPMAWLSGLGWAAAAFAGAVAGLSLTTHLTADLQMEAVLYQASLAVADDEEILG